VDLTRAACSVIARFVGIARIVVVLGLITVVNTASGGVSSVEWRPSRWCDKHLIMRLLEGADAPENAFEQFVFLSDALTAIGCLPPPPSTGCIRVGALWSCARQ
jgi:hypothetical protein